MKTKEAQDAQIIFRNPFRRLADESHAARGDVGDAADIVIDRAVRRHRQRVDGEIAARGVFRPIPAEYDLGLAAVSFDIAAQRRDLEWLAVNDDGNGAVFDAGRFRFQPGRFDAAHDLFRQCSGRQVDFLDSALHERIAYRAADNARFFAVAIEQREKMLDRDFFEPSRLAELRGCRHRVAPGTSLPPSICAGT